MKRFNKKRVVAGLAGVGILAIAAGAYAYFTTTGSGTATATVGSSTALVIKGTVTGNLYPGTSSPVSLTIDNNSTGKQRVGTISGAGHFEIASASQWTWPRIETAIRAVLDGKLPPDEKAN